MKKITLLLLSLLLAAGSYAQSVGINADGTAPDGSAMLDVKSTDKGMLIPRVALTGTTDVTTISSPATSLLVYNTATAGDVTPGFYYWDGSSWTPIGGSSPTTYSVGDFAQGGIIFWVDETGQHGLVAAKEDQSSGARWYAGTSGYTRANGDGPYAGEANTSIIIAAQVAIGDNGDTYAARICNALKITEGSKTYGDWYLPSKEELNLMYQNKATINTTAGANGGSSFASTYYWSSTENLSTTAWRQSFSSDAQADYSKSNSYRVRAIRAF
jgi:hypothetical protein